MYSRFGSEICGDGSAIISSITISKRCWLRLVMFSKTIKMNKSARHFIPDKIIKGNQIAKLVNLTTRVKAKRNKKLQQNQNDIWLKGLFSILSPRNVEFQTYKAYKETFSQPGRCLTLWYVKIVKPSQTGRLFF